MVHGRFEYLAVVGVASCIWACSGPQENKEQAEHLVGELESADFRGVNIGDHPSVVVQAETAPAVFAMPDELVYKLPLHSGDSVFYEISYNFDEKGLYDITMNIMSTHYEVLGSLKGEIIDLYRNKLGDPKRIGTRLSWRTMTRNGRLVDIAVEDSLRNNNFPALRINFNESE